MGHHVGGRRAVETLGRAAIFVIDWILRGCIRARHVRAKKRKHVDGILLDGLKGPRIHKKIGQMRLLRDNREKILLWRTLPRHSAKYFSLSRFWQSIWPSRFLERSNEGPGHVIGCQYNVEKSETATAQGEETQGLPRASALLPSSPIDKQ